ncbi:TRAP transporter substrate-binding protein [Moorena producens]|uniref:TRAP transporter substrate-binding protein n=1 Tax=Moorena producens TaxID=1155739 RepID=UPI003C7653B9
MSFIIDAIKQVLLWFIENFIKDVYEGIKRWVKNPKRKLYPIIIVVVLIVTVLGGWYFHKVTERPKIEKQYVKWKMISFLGKETDKIILSQAPRKLKDKIYDMTNGQFIIDIDKKSQINTDTDSILEKVSDGEVDCAYNGIYYNDIKYRPLFFGSAIPFGLNTQQQNAWLSYKKRPNNKLTFIQSIYKELGLNVIPFPVAATGGQMGGWFKKEIKSIDDFNGLVMRIPGLGAEVLSEFGVKTDKQRLGEALRPKEISQALKTNKIDAAEWIGPHDDVELGLNKNTKYYYYPGWWEPGTTFDIQVNLDSWDKLSDHYKAIFKAACHETLIEILAEYDHKNGEQLQKIHRYNDFTEVKQFSPEIMKRAEAKTNEILNLYAEGNDIFGDVYEEWQKFKNRIQPWHNTVNDYAD